VKGTMNYYDQIEAQANQRLGAALTLPSISDDGLYSDGECFDPWDLFPCVYGSYSSAFDNMAIDVLIDLRDGTFNRDDLASEMFREMLCVAGYCDYGTSPRTCFPTSVFGDSLPRLIQRWQEYSNIRWGNTS